MRPSIVAVFSFVLLSGGRVLASPLQPPQPGAGPLPINPANGAKGIVGGVILKGAGGAVETVGGVLDTVGNSLGNVGRTVPPVAIIGGALEGVGEAVQGVGSAVANARRDVNAEPSAPTPSPPVRPSLEVMINPEASATVTQHATVQGRAVSPPTPPVKAPATPSPQPPSPPAAPVPTGGLKAGPPTKVPVKRETIVQVNVHDGAAPTPTSSNAM